MSLKRRIALLSFLAAASGALRAEPMARQVDRIINLYVSATEAQKAELHGLSMAVSIDASLPKLKKTGKLQALRQISKIGEITYRALRFDGDNTVKKDVIARYLAAETAARNGGGDLAINQKNYRFCYKAMLEQDGQRVHIIELKPRKKRIGLFKGEIWIDGETFLPVRESGTFVKNPSVFLRKVEFTREYEVLEGVAVPTHIASKIETRLVGAAEIDVKYSNVTRAATDQAMTLTETARQ